MPPKEYSGRVLTLYFDSTKECNEIIEASRSAGVTVACFCREMIRKGMDLQAAPRPDLLQESTKAREELARLRRELRDKDAAIGKLETELFTLKSSILLQPIPSGIGQFSSELVDLLQAGGTWRSGDIMKALRIDAKNIDAIKALAGQLRALQDLRMVEEGPHGWKWT